jgi:hypothetical protein
MFPRRRTSSLSGKFLTLATLALTALAIGGFSVASADTYDVQVCSPTTTGSDALFGPFSIGPGGGPTFMFVDLCDGLEPETLSEQSAAAPVLKGNGRAWELRAPDGAVIRTLGVDQSFVQATPPLHSFLDWELLTAAGKQLAHVRDDRPLKPSHEEYTVNSSSVIGVLYCFPGLLVKVSCPEPGGPTPASFRVLLKNLFVVVDDLSPPAVSRPEVPETVRGTVEIPIAASDAGAGLNELTLVVDDTVVDRQHDENGGKCHPPYSLVTPCKPEITTSFSLDTSSLAEGPHDLVAMAVDASGQTSFSAVTRFFVRNGPSNIDRPRITGSARVGAQLVGDPGRWEGSPANAFQWLRCPATTGGVDDETGCVPIPGATTPAYVPTEAENGQRAVLKVTATNAAGTVSALSAPTDPITPVIPIPSPPPPDQDRTAPLLKKVVLSHKRLRLGASAKAGATSLLFSSNEGGKLTIVLERPRRGHKSRHVLSLAATIKAGRIAVPLGPSFASRHLAPGPYRLTITVRDAAGNLSKPARVSFRVLRG